MKHYKLLDLFCGRFGWSRGFAVRGWECVGIDLIQPPDIPPNCTFLQQDILNITPRWIELQGFDFICVSSPCEQFSVHGLRCFHPNPPYPILGILLFNHARRLCEASGAPYIMENVRSAQDFVGQADAHCGPFYLWGNAVPPLLPQGITKGIRMGSGAAVRGMSAEKKKAYRKQFPSMQMGSRSKERQAETAGWATIQPLLSAAVCDYAERLLESRELFSLEAIEPATGKQDASFMAQTQENRDNYPIRKGKEDAGLSRGNHGEFMKCIRCNWKSMSRSMAYPALAGRICSNCHATKLYF